MPRKLRIEYPGAMYHVINRAISAKTYSGHGARLSTAGRPLGPSREELGRWDDFEFQFPRQNAAWDA